jgi:hypothetical protein
LAASRHNFQASFTLAKALLNPLTGFRVANTPRVSARSGLQANLPNGTRGTATTADARFDREGGFMLTVIRPSEVVKFACFLQKLTF